MQKTTPQTLLAYLALAVGLLASIGFAIWFWVSGLLGWPYGLLIGFILGLITWLLSYIIIGRNLIDHLNHVFDNFRGNEYSGEPNLEARLDQPVFHRLNRALMKWSEKTEDQIEELKKAENYRREFVGNVSHELKTPIFNIQGYVHTLLEGGLEDENISKKYLEKAVKNVERLSAIVEDLEAISQLETGQLQLNYERFDLKRLANDVIDSLEITAKERNITLDQETVNQPNVLVMGDIGRIRQVLTNLLSNSIKYGKAGGQTIIRLHDEEERVKVEIADDGIGIDKDHLPRLFERFYRVDKSRSREQGGTGLGLSIVKHILEAHGQSIEVDSEPGKGTTFWFYLDKP